MADPIGGEGVLEDKQQEKGSDGTVKRWLKEIDLSEKGEKDWTSSVKNALKIYNGEQFRDEEHTKRKETFNILWSNVETKRPALYNSIARPDIRRRFRDADPIGKACAELLERAASFTIEEGFDDEVIAAVNDMLVPGRAITRVKYKPTLGEIPEPAEGVEPEDPEVLYQEIQFDQVQWDDFRRGPGSRWKDVPWVAFYHTFTKDHFKREGFGEFAEVVTFSETADEADDSTKKSKDTERSVFKKTGVWEIWDKSERKVLFISTSYKDKPLKVMDDPLRLKDFFNIPRPMYAIESSTSLVPTAEYTMYETLAVELEKITNRLNKILDGLRLRGIYDSSIAEMEKLFDEQDNGFVPAEDVARLAESGGLEKAIWMLPIKEMAEVLVHLYQRRDSLVQEIYEITGISDLQRGQTAPEETLGAQQLKANFGNQRMQRQQREVQRYIRDLIRVAVELIAENFSPEMLGMMTGIQFPTGEEKEAMIQAYQAEAMLAQQQQQPPPPPPDFPPSWDEIMEIIQNDVLRDFKVDVETDSTIEAEQKQDQEDITKLLTGIVQFIQGMGPAVEAGYMSAQTAKALMMASVRRFRLGREVEDALEEMDTQPAPQGNGEADAAKQVAEMEVQAKQAEMQAQAEARKQEQQMKREQWQYDKQEAVREAQFKKMEHQNRMKELAMKHRATVEKHQMDMQKARQQPKKASNG